MKVELVPKAGNASARWHVYQEIAGDRGRRLRMTDAGYELGGGTVWFRNSIDSYGEAIGATVDAESVNLGEDGAFATDIMVKMAVARQDGDRAATCYVARAFGPTVAAAREGLRQLLSSPERLEAETESVVERLPQRGPAPGDPGRDLFEDLPVVVAGLPGEPDRRAHRPGAARPVQLQ